MRRAAMNCFLRFFERRINLVWLVSLSLPKRMTSSPCKTVAVILRGLAFAPNYVHFSGQRVNVDFRRTADSIRRNLINGFERVRLHLVTYPDLPDDLRDALSHVYSDGIHNVTTNQIHYMDTPSHKGSQRAVFERCLRVAATERESSDLVVICRFDLDVKTPVAELRIDPDRVNFMWRETTSLQRPPPSNTNNDRVGCDAIHVFPPRLADPLLLQATRALPASNNLHGLPGALADLSVSQTQQQSLVAFVLDDETYDSNTDASPNPIYRIDRGDATRMLGGHSSRVFWKKMLGTGWTTLK